jgi:hypothetical protein
MRWLAASIASCALFCAAGLGTFLPLRDAAGIQYIFVWPGAVALLSLVAIAAAALSTLYYAVARRAQRHGPERVQIARAGRWLAPMAAPALCVFGVVPAVPGVGEFASALGYFFYDLRWWWLAAAIVGVIIRVDRLIGEPVGRRFRAVETWSPRRRLLLFDTVVLLGVMSCAGLSTRHFAEGLHGDEPKYIRYCEAWYQGTGFEVSSVVPFRELPLDGSSRVFRNAALFVRGIGEESRALRDDLNRFFADPKGFTWNRAQRNDGFVTGKRGGKYQIYMPGASFFLFPGYYLDRHLVTLPNPQDGEFPAQLVMTHLTMLFLYGMCAVALFRLLRRALMSDALALFWAAVAMLTLPTAAFAFQFYPEIPALLVIVLLTTYVWFHAPAAHWIAAGVAGAAAGGLAWFHPRFLLVSAVLTAWGTFRTVPHRARLTFVCAAALAGLSVMAFAYRVTGSWMPNALWEAPGSDATLNLQAAPVTIFGYALDRMWGTAPHTPLFLAALPGLALLARQSPGPALFVLAIGLALAVPAAAHTLSAAGGTPGRLIVAVVPLFILPVAIFVRTFWSSFAVRTAAFAALVISVEAAFSYNWHHFKAMGAMRSMGASGWRLNLGFPVVSGGGWTDFPANVALFWVMVALLGLATALAFLRARTPIQRNDTRIRGWVPAATLAAIVLGSVGSTAFNRRWVHADYLGDDADARRAAAEALVTPDECRVCFATRDPAIDWRWLDPNGAERVNVETSVNVRTARVRVILDGTHGPLRFGRIRAEFGDGFATRWTGIVGTRELVHTYEQPGEYPVVVWLQLRNGEMRAGRQTISIPGSRGD